MPRSDAARLPWGRDSTGTQRATRLPEPVIVISVLSTNHAYHCPYLSPPGHLTLNFVNREEELAELRALAERPEPSLALLYGRRRMGKTFLLSRAWADRRHLYYLAADSTQRANRGEFVREMARWSGQDLREADFPSWRTIFRFLVGLADDDPLVVVFDEVQYLLGGEDDFASNLVAVWDRELRSRALTLVLCGSEVGVMGRLRAGDSPLYGRINWAARLRPFDYLTAREMVPGLDLREAAEAYGIFGGTPRYLSVVGEARRLREPVIRSLLSPRGEVHLQLETLIEQEKGIREPAEYRAVLAAVAAGRTLHNDIAAAAGLLDRPQTARRALSVLGDLGLVWRERNHAASPRTPWRSRVADNAVRFWYRFVYPNRSRLETGSAELVWAESVAPNVATYMGPVFEEIGREAYRRHHPRWGLPGARTWSRWEGADRSRRSMDIDMVAELDDGSMLTGEVKWSSRPIDHEVHVHLTRDLAALSDSGHAWAGRALSQSGHHVYVSAAGFTEHFRERAAEHGRIRLVGLDDLY